MTTIHEVFEQIDAAWMPDDPGLVCSVDEPAIMDRRGEIRVDCIKPAVWVGFPPCGHEGMFCEQHHSDTRPFKCRQCGNTTLLATYRWVRL